MSIDRDVVVAALQVRGQPLAHEALPPVISARIARNPTARPPGRGIGMAVQRDAGLPGPLACHRDPSARRGAALPTWSAVPARPPARSRRPVGRGEPRPGHLRHGGALGGHQRRTAGERLERGARTPLRVRDRPPPRTDGATRGPPRRADSRTHDALGMPGGGEGRSRLRHSPAGLTAHTSTASGWRRATLSKAATSGATPLRGSSVPTKATSGRSIGTPNDASSARSAPSAGSSGVNRRWSTPCGATTTGARTSQQARTGPRSPG